MPRRLRPCKTSVILERRSGTLPRSKAAASIGTVLLEILSDCSVYIADHETAAPASEFAHIVSAQGYASSRSSSSPWQPPRIARLLRASRILKKDHSKVVQALRFLSLWFILPTLGINNS